MLSALVCRSTCSDSGAREGVGVGEVFTKIYLYLHISSSDSGARVGVGVGEVFTKTYIYIYIQVLR